MRHVNHHSWQMRAGGASWQEDEQIFLWGPIYQQSEGDEFNRTVCITTAMDWRPVQGVPSPLAQCALEIGRSRPL
ncbi:hypothetical protein DNTS_023836 [Danionella cerebrum]|uniref:Uncharacterized protein n=1 Tax=Danionella cerebrum TaxID=2873325 RepID=A0A553QSY3_9TELE|nr:hypothetical protein DNTS_023836 [Danionella translucida]